MKLTRWEAKEKPSRFGKISGKALVNPFKNYYEKKKEIILGLLIQDIIESLRTLVFQFTEKNRLFS